jgi:hypothetical protein
MNDKIYMSVKTKTCSSNLRGPSSLSSLCGLSRLSNLR